MYDLLIAVFKGVGAFVLTMFNAMLDVLLAVVPDTWKAPTDTFVQYCRIANAWIPVDFAILLLLIYIAFKLAFTAFRFIFRVLRG